MDGKDSGSYPKDAVVETCVAPVNIAVIKYWGKRDTKLVLPTNSSLSGTLDTNAMRSRTTIIASREYKKHAMKLNGKEVDVGGNKRLMSVIKALLAMARDFIKGGKTLIKATEWPEFGLNIISDNNFPTAAGLASSASGLACFTKCLAQVYQIPESETEQLTAVARQGSGSACRSLHGGFVMWEKGTEADGSDSIAKQIVDEKHWPEMRVLICVVSKGEKKIGSTMGMQQSVETSTLLKHRIDHVVPKRMDEMMKAIKGRDFTAFAKLTMTDSNQFHAICLDTDPPLFYMNDTSRDIIDCVNEFNATEKGIRAAYTYDAGPNACIYLLKDNMEDCLAKLISEFCPKGFKPEDFVYDPMELSSYGKKCSSKNGDEGFSYAKLPDSGVKMIIVTKIGAGAKIIPQ
mmetsp:Transcript_16749/g.23450  ORF Transcript_16749/g.23450 Transcript_16749/m.23450 type:complete len:403 (+) Transcript_16749:36-1244(+)|eukprot:CAMPEP_0184488180 /NCGR_PEP_ID=MMETSP0113_2-20130426/10574_1 /TAXON_ID=91329 /ORGANISM="Norrisiella sphaerica, Strain BC52" /LENGTH=402 /DNA_ID=CAMNT_0026870673 /DNA_START=31 /DNA_END=1239 /DNA_ORIENTATION=+